MIELTHLSLAYADKSILEDISLKIESHFTLLGANGSGKSTLAKALASLIEYQGEIKIEGREIRTIAPKERAKLLSYIPTKLEAYDTSLSLFDFVLMGRFPFKKNFFDYSQEDRERVKESLKYFNIIELQEHSLHSLSSGESQLALIAQALTQKSRIIIFDEPTANLDPKNSQIIAKHIKALQASGQIFLITHDIRLAEFIGAPIGFIKERKLLSFEEEFFQSKTLSELYEVAFDTRGVIYA